MRVVCGCHVGLYLRGNIVEDRSGSRANTLDHSLTWSPPGTRLVSGSISSPCHSGVSYVTWRRMELTLHRVVWQRHSLLTQHPMSSPYFPGHLKLWETNFANGLWTEVVMSVQRQNIWKVSEQLSGPYSPDNKNVSDKAVTRRWSLSLYPQVTLWSRTVYSFLH